MKTILKTNKGDITLELFDTITVNTVANFTKLAKEGFYDGVRFHRVIKNFMIQSGDPLTRDVNQKSAWGTGGPGYKFADEITDTNSNEAFTISMANAGPNTNGSQFFINLVDNLFLNSKHTVFGKVIDGVDIVKNIGDISVDDRDRPLDDVVIESVEVL